MSPDDFLSQFGEQNALALAGGCIGLVFGVMAQRSKFCMRSAVIDCVSHDKGRNFSKLAIWLLAFSTALILTQGFALLGSFDAGSVRQLSTPGSISGAITGGLLLGLGMILSRGCPSRMLILSSSGNLRALLAGLFFVVTAQATISGVLVPLREWISNGWTVDAGARDALALLGIGHWGGVAIGMVWLLPAIVFARRSSISAMEWAGGIGVGITVAVAWWLTYQISTRTFDIVVTVQAISFTNPSSEVLMWLLARSGSGWDYAIALVPGVVVGALLASLWGKDFHIEGFGREHIVLRYLAGATCMGMGGVLAGGCAVGAGVSGAAVFGLTAWIALFFMWVGAAAAHLYFDRPQAT